jgi:methylmalonyl-CoA mutase
MKQSVRLEFYTRFGTHVHGSLTQSLLYCSGLPTDQSARVARNTQLILQEETGMCDVADPWGGSYMMESLTDELLQKAKTIIDEVEEKGGMTAFINSGTAKLMIEESATKKQGRIDSGQETVVGVNKYQLNSEEKKAEMIDVFQIDNSEVRDKQIARMNEVKANRDEAAAQEALERLEASARKSTSTSHGDNPDNLMKLCIDCARVR